MKEIFIWQPEFTVNVKLIDSQHKKFIKLMNSVFSTITSTDSSEQDYKKVVKKLFEFGKIHFATEEQYFDKFHYELAKEHKEQHRKIIEELAQFSLKTGESYKAVGKELLMFLEGWLIDHLAYWDKKYTQCFNEHGLY